MGNAFRRRGVVDLLYFAELSQHRVAEHLKVPVETVKSRSQQAIQNLRTTLSGANR